MCILSFLPEGIEITDESIADLEMGGLLNPDGHGWAISIPAGVIMRRTLSLDEALDTFIDARLQHPRGAAMFHSRWATHGAKTVANCHPFIVGSDYRTVMAHNGVIRRCLPAKGDPRSDTGVMAGDIMPKMFRRLDKPSVRNALEQYIGTGNKVAVITGNPRYRRTGYIFGESRGHWDGFTGLWHSNSDYRWREENTSAADSHHREEDTSAADSHHRGELQLDSSCAICWQDAVNSLAICTNCGTCQDCLEPDSMCLCYRSYADRIVALETN